MLLRFAIKVGRYQGRNVYRVPVIIRHNSSRDLCTLKEREFTVLARSAAEAANWARDNEAGNIPETEIIAFGPKGGRVDRFIGWESAIANEVFGAGRAPLQLRLDSALNTAR